MGYIPAHGLPEPLLNTMSRHIAQHVAGLGDIGLGMPHISLAKIGVLGSMILKYEETSLKAVRASSYKVHSDSCVR